MSSSTSTVVRSVTGCGTYQVPGANVSVTPESGNSRSVAARPALTTRTSTVAVGSLRSTTLYVTLSPSMTSNSVGRTDTARKSSSRISTRVSSGSPDETCSGKVPKPRETPSPSSSIRSSAAVIVSVRSSGMSTPNVTASRTDAVVHRGDATELQIR